MFHLVVQYEAWRWPNKFVYYYYYYMIVATFKKFNNFDWIGGSIDQ